MEGNLKDSTVIRSVVCHPERACTRKSREDRPEGMMGGASETRVDLHAAIDRLLLFKSDLEAYYWSRSDDRERYQIALWMRQTSERTAALTDVLMHMGSPTVVVMASAADRDRLRSAVDGLDRGLDDARPFDEVLCVVGAVLSAADVVCLRAAGGRPDAAVCRDAVHVERIAMTGMRGTGIVLARIVPRTAPRRPTGQGAGTPTRNVGS